jgi:hypothetical protein
MSTTDEPKTPRVDSNAPTQPRMRAVVASSEAATRRIKPVKPQPREAADEAGRYSQVFGRFERRVVDTKE